MRLALFQPDIPQNLGAALRLAVCPGVSLDVIEPCGFPLGERAIRRAAMDYGAKADATRHASFGEFLTKSATRLVLFTTRAAQPFHRFARSLNVVTAAAMSLAESLRQTDGFPSAAESG